MGPPTDALEPAPKIDHVLDRIENTLGRRRHRRVVARRTVPGAAVMFVATLAVVTWRQSSSSDVSTAPLASATGIVLPEGHQLQTGETQFSDGSKVQLDGDAQVEVVSNTTQRFATVLRAGRVAFDVVPQKQAARQWVIDAGDVKVEVVGTQFSVERRLDLVEVAVSRGAVRVRGDAVDKGETLLTAGERVQVTTARAPRRSPARATAPDTKEVIEATGISETSPAPTNPQTPGEPDRGALRQADDLRRAGKHQEAANLLASALQGAPRGGQSALMALTLARVQIGPLGQPRAAAASFDRAVRDGLPPALREQALARSVEAWARAGQHETAVARAQQYLGDYRRGPSRDSVLRWLERAGGQ